MYLHKMKEFCVKFSAERYLLQATCYALPKSLIFFLGPHCREASFNTGENATAGNTKSSELKHKQAASLLVSTFLHRAADPCPLIEANQTEFKVLFTLHFTFTSHTVYLTYILRGIWDLIWCIAQHPVKLGSRIKDFHGQC